MATLGLASLLAAGGGEVALRLLVPGSSHYYVLRPNLRAVMTPDPATMQGVSPIAHYVVNAQGVRGPLIEPRRKEFRILAVGGSTTELLYIDEPRTWTARLQELLPRTASGERVWVGNVGRSGMNARDHVVQVKHLPDELPGINAIVLLAGVNDLTVALAADGAFAPPPPLTDPAAEQQQVRRAFTIAPGSLANPNTEDELVATAPWYKRTAIYQLGRRAKLNVLMRLRQDGIAQDPRGMVIQRWRTNRRSASVLRDALPPLDVALAEYRRDLMLTVDHAQEHGIQLILLTQPSIWRPRMTPPELARLWLGGVGDFQVRRGEPYYSTAALAEAMQLFNDVTLDVCRARGLRCLDLARALARDTLMFYDDVHFTEAGSEHVATAVAAFLRLQPPFRDAASQ